MALAVVTFAEQRDGKLRRAALEALSEGRRLAQALGGTVDAVVVGAGIEALADELGRYGASRVHVYDDPALGQYATEPYARAVAQVAAEGKPKAVLIPFTAMGKDLAPRIAGRLGAGLVSDCVALAVKDGRLEARRPMYAGKAYATVRWEGEPQMATLRPNVFPLGEPDAAAKTQVVTGTVDTSARARVTAVHAGGTGKVELSEAQIIVSGGRGLKGPENFHLVQALADALGAAVGASRAVVDAGWVDHQYQVGQTGKTVSPTLYVAAGISGAIQHLAGMSSSKVIVAINKDPDAPIFKVANYGLVGDVFEILPKLTEAARQHFSKKG
ncbi:MAG TPA: electron transfer flavoprotein subunit alpha/FixB family protein [Vicinamibacteria bacterium]|nr:electron transfer flavoprotein subunit alpha/FixB family protein [Vicinamibacteria bacterium]